MAAPYNPPKKNEDFNFAIALEDLANPGRYKSNPTIAAGDFTISKDYAAFANLATLPDVEPNSTYQVRLQLSSTEMNADVIFILAHDQTDPPEWADWSFCILTTA
jgi:hypothetical protein